MTLAERTIVVTGGTGNAGSWIVDALADHGAEVVCLDRRLPVNPREDVRFYTVDLTDLGETAEIIQDADPDDVVHFGAIPDPESDAGSRVFVNNTVSTYNVLTAAGRAGAGIVWSSSESAYGFAWAEEQPLPNYLPIDEDHPMEPEDPYGTSKIAGEEIAKMVTRRYGVPAVSLRLSWIQYPGRYEVSTGPEIDPVAVSTSTFWSYVDIRDVVSVVETSLSADLDGHEAFNVHAADNHLGQSTATAFETTFGEYPEPCVIKEDEAAYTTAKAKRVLDWTPEHSWREAENEPIDRPTLFDG